MWKREPGASRRQPKTPQSFGSEGVSNICSPRVWCRKNGPTEGGGRRSVHGGLWGSLRPGCGSRNPYFRDTSHNSLIYLDPGNCSQEFGKGYTYPHFIGAV